MNLHRVLQALKILDEEGLLKKKYGKRGITHEQISKVLNTTVKRQYADDKLAKAIGRSTGPIKAAAKKFKVSESTVYRWRREYQ